MLPIRSNDLWNHPMFRTRFWASLPIAACALALTLALGGCVAAVAPLTQLAATQFAPKPPCVAGLGCQTNASAGSFGEMSLAKRLPDATRECSVAGTKGEHAGENKVEVKCM